MGPLCKACAARLGAELDTMRRDLYRKHVAVQDLANELRELRAQIHQLTGTGSPAPTAKPDAPELPLPGGERRQVCPGCGSEVKIVLHQGVESYEAHCCGQGQLRDVCAGSWVRADVLLIDESAGPGPADVLDVTQDG